jgi:putative ABC transport system ATP-binding protein
MVVEHISKQFHQGTGTVDALVDVSLRIDRGEFVAIMGASGSGKSTLLHVMAGLTEPSSGRVLVDGIDLSTLSDRDRTLLRRGRIGVVFQAFNLIPALTAEQNILLPLLAGGQGGRTAGPRLESLLDALNLQARRHHRPDALSGGEQQRAAIARALIGEASIVLADEPTGSLDSVAGQSLCALLRQLCTEQGRTIVVVTHEPAVAAWADRVVVLRDGRVLTHFAVAEFRDPLALAAHSQSLVRPEGLTPSAMAQEVRS